MTVRPGWLKKHPSVQDPQLRIRATEAARLHAGHERTPNGVRVSRFRPLPRHLAAADVHRIRHGVAVQPVLDQPVRRRRPRGLTPLSLGLPALLGGNPAAGAVEVLLLDAFEEAEQGEARGLVVHTFDSMITAVTSNPSPGRYLLLLASDGRTVQRGWWHNEETARYKFRRWIGEYGNMPDAQITLTDEDTGEQLATWPEEPAPAATTRPGPP